MREAAEVILDKSRLFSGLVHPRDLQTKMWLTWLLVALFSGGYVNSGPVPDFTWVDIINPPGPFLKEVQNFFQRSWRSFITFEPTWQSLRVTWGVNLLSSRVFAKLPLTESRARSEGFAKLSGSCSGGKFLGHRYMKGLDTAAVLLYDVNGFIAGIQFGIPKNDVHNLTAFSYENTPAFVHDKIFGEEEIYFLTAYFVDPRIICTRGRTRQQYLEDGTGTGLFLQNGTNPIEDTKEVPLYEKDLAGTRWVKGGCFRSMGVHYWYDVSENMSCTNLFPFTVIYNRGKLTNFAFSAPGNFEFSKRFEHPPRSTLSLFLPTPVPKCIERQYDTAGGFSTMHVYFTVRPWNLFC